MTSTKLSDGRVLLVPHIYGEGPGMVATPLGLSGQKIADLVQLIPADQLLFFTKRLVSGTIKRRHESRWHEANVSRLKLARACLERALTEGLA